MDSSIGAVDDSTAKHLPECPVINGAVCPHDPRCNCQCMCKMLRACEQRVREDERNAAGERVTSLQWRGDGTTVNWITAILAARGEHD